MAVSRDNIFEQLCCKQRKTDATRVSGVKRGFLFVSMGEMTAYEYFYVDGKIQQREHWMLEGEGVWLSDGGERTSTYVWG